tara:strand:+ start:430 stop:1269 length:840 start_codon:yes stop_codon:yes gene_type:complete
MIVSHKNKFIFFKPMKVAGSSIEHGLIKHCGEADLLTGDREHEDLQPRNSEDFHSHTTPDMFFEKYPAENWSDYYKFTAVRNPWDTVVSYYWYATGKSKKTDIDTSNFDEVKEDFNNWLNRRNMFNWPQWSEEPMSGKELLDLLVETARRDTGYSRVEVLRLLRENRMKVFAKYGTVVNCHGSSLNKFWNKSPLQYIARINEYFYDDRLVHHTIRYENLEEDYKKVCDQLSLSHEDLVKFKSNYRKLSVPYTEYYNDNTRKMVFREFEWTIERFKYKFG